MKRLANHIAFHDKTSFNDWWSMDRPEKSGGKVVPEFTPGGQQRARLHLAHSCRPHTV